MYNLYNAGVAVGTEFCNQESLAVTSTTLWSFTTGIHNNIAIANCIYIIISHGVIIQAVLSDLRTVEALVLVSSSRSRNCRQALSFCLAQISMSVQEAHSPAPLMPCV